MAWNDIDNALMGLGAGLHGKGLEFRQQQNEMQKRSALSELANLQATGQITPQEYLSRLSVLDPETGVKIQLQQAGIGSPAGLQYFNRLQQLKDSGDLEGFNLLSNTLKLGEKGTQYDAQGNIVPQPGYADTTAFNAAAKAGAEEAAKQGVQIETAPLIEGAKTGARLGAEREGVRADKEVKAESILPIVEEARKILPNSTSGLVGQISTGVSKKFGQSTDASKADARLKVLAAALTSNVPRFEGPQGVLDVELYKQAAADVANSEIPYEDRLAALDTVESMQQRYLKTDSDAAKPTKKPVTEMTDEELMELLK